MELVAKAATKYIPCVAFEVRLVDWQITFFIKCVSERLWHVTAASTYTGLE